MYKAVFVVGAGASKDFGLPLGLELVAEVRQQLQGEIGNPVASHDSIIGLAMRSGQYGDFGEAARDLCGGLVTARSVDRLLDSRKDRPLVVELGKCAIAACIAQKESGTAIGAIPNDRKWEAVQAALLKSNESWLAGLFSILHEGIAPAKADAILSPFAFVTFNYDRCIERYLQLAFQHILGLGFDQAAELVETIPILHVYGSLGQLPGITGMGIPYGPSPERLRESVGYLRTFTEGAESSTLMGIRSLLINAERVVFLGFAFDELNVTALFPQPLEDDQHIWGTGMGLTDSDKDRISTRITAKGDRIGYDFPGWTCGDFIRSERFRAFIER